MRKINGRVERARTKGEFPEADVLQGIKSANEMNIDVVAFLGKGENKLCFNWCPNIYWRYWLGKVSKEKTDRVSRLKENFKCQGKYHVRTYTELPKLCHICIFVHISLLLYLI